MNIRQTVTSLFSKQGERSNYWKREKKLDPNQSRVKQTMLVVIILLAIVIALSAEYYTDEFHSFYPQILAEAHGMVFDLFVVGVLVFYFDKSREKRWMITHYTEELEDLAAIKTTESALRASGLIKRLNRLGASSLRINGIHLSKTNLRKCDLSNASMLEADLSGVKAEKANFHKALINNTNLKNAMINEATFEKAYAMSVDFSGCFCIQTIFINAMLVSSVFDSAYLMKTDFEGAILVDASFKGASLNRCNFRNTQGLTVEMIMAAKTWDGAMFDPEFEIKLKNLTDSKLIDSITKTS
jgi:uncharacterized protein YjbI with pentapeptide repeats